MARIRSIRSWTSEGENRARFLMFKLLKRARQRHVGLPPLTQTRYINTISPEQEPYFPGDEELERRIRRLVRWNAVAMVLRANNRVPGHRRPPRHLRLGRDPVRGRLQPLLQGQGRRGRRRPGLLPGPRRARASTPGRSSRAGCPRTSSTTSGARSAGQGPELVPAPAADARVLGVPDGLDGHRPAQRDLPGAVQPLPRRTAASRTPRAQRVWAFLGDGEMDEPESIAGLSLAAREGLDNLTFVVNCNLQRLDGPVRGNGKIIQELEGLFRGAGWNVIKVDLGPRVGRAAGPRRRRRPRREDERDPRRRVPEVLGRRAGRTSGSTSSGPTRACAGSSSTSATTTSLKLRRGGHDYRKVYAAYKAATEYVGAPTVILAKTIKGWTLGPGVEARNITHQAKKLTETELQGLPRPPRAADPGRRAQGRALLPPGTRLGRGALPARAARGPRRAAAQARSSARKPLPAPRRRSTPSSRRAARPPSARRWCSRGCCATSSAIPRSGQRIVPIIPDEARTFGMDPLFKEVGIYAAHGQRYEPVDSDLVLSYREARDGQVLEEGITEAGSMASLHRRGDRLRDARHADGPVLHLLLDVRLPADRRPDVGVRGRARPRVHDRRHGRPDDAAGEGLQHDDGHSHVLASTVPECPGLRPGVRLRAGGDRPRRRSSGCTSRARTSTTTSRSTTRTTRSRRCPTGSTTGSSAACTGSPRRPTGVAGKGGRVRLVGSGSILQQVLAAQRTARRAARHRGRGLQRAVVPAAPPRRADVERWNRLHPDAEPRVPYVSQVLGADGGPVVDRDATG